MGEYRNSNFFRIIMARMAVQVPALMDLVLEVAVQALAFKAKVIMVVLISNLAKGVSGCLAIRVIQRS